MNNALRIALAQLNLTVGDITANIDKMIAAAKTARDQEQADLIIFPELAITGYPPEDLLLRPAFIAESNRALNEFMHKVEDIYCCIGHPHYDKNKLFNACSIIYNHQVLGRYYKEHLPNYGVFDEARYFASDKCSCIVNIKHVPVGFMICEDIWYQEPIKKTVAEGAELIVVINASPFEINKPARRRALLTEQAEALQTSIIYVNCVGGQDELVFDGGSMVVADNGDIVHLSSYNQETLDLITTKPSAPTLIQENHHQQIYDCLVLGMRDYLHKNHALGAIIGISGGIDSALSLAIANDAIGADNITAVFMPSRYTADISYQDAELLTKNLQIDLHTIHIDDLFANFLTTLTPYLSSSNNIVPENIQARCRAVILMALSNQTGRIVLATSNHSELAVGYTTLYGDLAGGFAALKNVPKTLVYELAQYRNQISPIIPQRTLNRPPTAELALEQKDSDTLPSYEILDQILELYINQEKSITDIIALNFDAKIVDQVITLLKKNEYKRKQAPIGIHLQRKSFGRDFRYPIVDKFKN